MTAEELVAAAKSRADCKRLGARLDAEPDLKPAVVALARANGVDLPDDAPTWPGKRLLRLARGREASSREIGNPVALDEAFTCVSCGREVPRHGRSARDHCPWCLVGLHVDDRVPGDRASTCRARLDPVAVEQKDGRWILVYRCSGCGATRRNQVLMDGDPPDRWAAVVALTGRMP
ncbi:MAG: RNHCP domain-containing protein [Myxococcales bacterium]|nr:RNHCP domain-containing protein [Myxococcales bacterium]